MLYRVVQLALFIYLHGLMLVQDIEKESGGLWVEVVDWREKTL